jgi:hypothetical protein
MFDYLDGLQIFKGDAQVPKWLSPGAKNMIKRILDPNPVTRITTADIKADEWFKLDYTPMDSAEEQDDVYIDDAAFSIQEAVRTRDSLIFVDHLLIALVLLLKRVFLRCSHQKTGVQNHPTSSMLFN